ncbi:MAG: hypothetical protein AAF429_05095 [Pseudomonadota bacterium]
MLNKRVFLSTLIATTTLTPLQALAQSCSNGSHKPSGFNPERTPDIHASVQKGFTPSGKANVAGLGAGAAILGGSLLTIAVAEAFGWTSVSGASKKPQKAKQYRGTKSVLPNTGQLNAMPQVQMRDGVLTNT